jgi:hypothetical protein
VPQGSRSDREKAASYTNRIVKEQDYYSTQLPTDKGANKKQNLTFIK